tara:strand:- start:5715 stop:6236 length:522 start_codon:yes stop_codon:yes gene_type:complete
MEEIVLGGGCFWCTEAALGSLRGVSSVISGYSGGHVKDPTYEQICTKTTGHAEVVKVRFDSDKISRKDLLEVFFTSHDPTQLNRQGNDIGPQYRSCAFYSNEVQKRDIQIVINNLKESFVSDIVTEVSPLKNFYEAENYHQDYFANNPQNPYCRIVISPKLAKVRSKHEGLYE